MGSKEPSKFKITDIVGNLVKADQSHIKVDTPGGKKSGTADEEDVVILNVGGVRHETKISTLLKKPETRLYSVGETAKASGKREFFFDRNPQIFPCILNYYRIGKLHMPTDICGPAAKAELDYWELEDKDIEQCCWVNYISYEETLEMLEKFESDESEKYLSVYVSPEASFFAQNKPRLWRALQDPYSSRAALSYAILSFFVVLVSITVFVIETIPYFGSVYVHASDTSRNITSDDLRKEMDIFTDVTPNDVLLLIDNSCNIFFFIEFIVKMFASPDKKKFFKSPLVITELLCLIPYYIGVMIVLFHPNPISIFLMIRVLFATRVLRIFRIFVLMKHFLALKILMFTIRASTKELFLLLIVLIIGVVIFACIEYYMEIFSDEPTDFEHIPLAFWWALITMTTVGYGDVVPKSGLGYIIGGFCAISGVLVIALSVPVIVNNFTVYYTHAQSREKLKLRKKKFEQTEKWQRLKAGLKSKLKNGGLHGLLNGTRKRNLIEPSQSNPMPKLALAAKKGGGSSLKVPGAVEESSNGIEIPHTARDIILEDTSDLVRDAETSATADSISVIETNLTNGHIPGPRMLADSIEQQKSSPKSTPNTPKKKSIQKQKTPKKTLIRSKLFNHMLSKAKPKVKVVKSDNHNMKLLTPKKDKTP